MRRRLSCIARKQHRDNALKTMSLRSDLGTLRRGDLLCGILQHRCQCLGKDQDVREGVVERSRRHTDDVWLSMVYHNAPLLKTFKGCVTTTAGAELEAQLAASCVGL